MSSNEDAPALVKFGAGSDQSKRNVNLDVSGTLGPDHLSQQTVDVDGHPHDRPGVQSRLPENLGEDDPRIRRMDTGEDLPVLLSSKMRADPIEGVQGTYTKIIEGECARCGYDRLKVSVDTMPGERRTQCNACDALQNRHHDDGYLMPKTDEALADAERSSGEELTTIGTRTLCDMEQTTGMGGYVSLVGERDYTRLRKSYVADMFWALVENGDLDLGDEIEEHFAGFEVASLAVSLLPGELSVRPSDSPDE